MKTMPLAFGHRSIDVDLPDSADVRPAEGGMPLADPAAAIRRSLERPIGTPPLAALARGRSRAAIVVSDKTRPVPYKGPRGILAPILDILRSAGVGAIEVLVACGTHRPMEDRELRDMLGDPAFREGVRVINHIATDLSTLRSIGRTSRVPDVTLNARYLDADLKIATGLVEPHFMAGFSGGRKAICPGLCGRDVTYGFHSAALLSDPKATSLILDGNPCHEEALRIARMAGVDFTVNVTIDSAKRLTGIFSGELEEAHRAAVEHLLTYVTIPLSEPYDVVITQAGDVGVNHYQCAKAAVEASRAVKPEGHIILIADLTDPDPVGGENYKEMLRLAKRLGPAAFCERILAEDWIFVPDQWEVQMWAKVFIHLGDPERVHVCAPRLEHSPADLFPEDNVAARVGRLPDEADVAFARRMVQETIDRVLDGSPAKTVLVLPDGPYAVPVLHRA